MMCWFNLPLATCIIFKHISLSCNEPLYINIRGVGEKSCYVIFANTITLL